MTLQWSLFMELVNKSVFEELAKYTPVEEQRNTPVDTNFFKDKQNIACGYVAMKLQEDI